MGETAEPELRDLNKLRLEGGRGSLFSLQKWLRVNDENALNDEMMNAFQC